MGKSRNKYYKEGKYTVMMGYIKALFEQGYTPQKIIKMAEEKFPGEKLPSVRTIYHYAKIFSWHGLRTVRTIIKKSEEITQRGYIEAMSEIEKNKTNERGNIGKIIDDTLLSWVNRGKQIDEIIEKLQEWARTADTKQEHIVRDAISAMLAARAEDRSFLKMIVDARNAMNEGKTETLKIIDIAELEDEDIARAFYIECQKRPGLERIYEELKKRMRK